MIENGNSYSAKAKATVAHGSVVAKSLSSNRPLTRWQLSDHGMVELNAHILFTHYYTLLMAKLPLYFLPNMPALLRMILLVYYTHAGLPNFNSHTDTSNKKILPLAYCRYRFFVYIASAGHEMGIHC